jgi:Fe-S oxidoreductase
MDLLVYGFLQTRQPRFLIAGVLHILIFWGFVVLALRSTDLITQGIQFPVLQSLMHSSFGSFYNPLKDLFELIVLFACALALLRRAILKPERYQGSNQFEAYFVLCLISALMISDMFYEASALGLAGTDVNAEWLPATQLATLLLSDMSVESTQAILISSYWVHYVAFFFFLIYLPASKHFHVITALPNVFLRKLNKGAIKPARWGELDLEQLDSFGVEKFEDFTWKHILDFLTCTECGRCSDQCPAHTIGRPLSPKMLTIKLRDHGNKIIPLLKRSKSAESANNGTMIGDIITDTEIWSCTTCGACEQECPVFIEYIDKIIDMRRHLIETSRNPKSFNQILMHIEKTGNPFGKPLAKRADWVGEAGNVRILGESDEVDVLYFVDSYGSYEPRIQNIATSIITGLHLSGLTFGILGANERDSGHQVRRLGEEGLFQLLVEENLEALRGIRFKQIITTDPHAFNALKNDYPLESPVLHYSSFFQQLVDTGRLNPTQSVSGNDVYTYHDPCYLGRHNGVYEAPRKLLLSLPNLKLVEMTRSRDRSFCCGGGDVALWHDIEQEEMRMGEKRIRMALDVGANVIVTACPFCLLHFEDAIKTLGLEDNLRVVDLMELFIATLCEE